MSARLQFFPSNRRSREIPKVLKHYSRLKSERERERANNSTKENKTRMTLTKVTRKSKQKSMTRKIQAS